jgi:hypothetical protein
MQATSEIESYIESGEQLGDRCSAIMVVNGRGLEDEVAHQ